MNSNNIPAGSGSTFGGQSLGGTNVSIYTTPTCSYCRAAKEFFKEHNIAFTEYNVASDAEKRQLMIQKSGQMGVPVIFVDNEMVIGFDRDRLANLLGIA